MMNLNIFLIGGARLCHETQWKYYLSPWPWGYSSRNPADVFKMFLFLGYSNIMEPPDKGPSDSQVHSLTN